MYSVFHEVILRSRRDVASVMCFRDVCFDREKKYLASALKLLFLVGEGRRGNITFLPLIDTS